MSPQAPRDTDSDDDIVADTPPSVPAGRIGGVPLLPDAGAAGAPLTAVIAVISFLAALALASFFIVSNAANQWTSDLAGSMTVQVKGSSQAEITRQTDAVLRVLDSAEGVRTVRLMPRERAEELLEPWLGRGNLPEDLPLPAIISVDIEPIARSDLDVLRMRLAAAAPNASLDDHSAWNNRLASAARSGQALAFAVFSLVLGAACAISIFAARAGLAANKEIIDVLHLVGATDKFIARQVQRRFVVLSLRGATIGVVAAWIALALISASAGRAEGYFLPHVAPDVRLMIWLLTVPIISCLVAAGSARATVLRALAQRY